jgi:DNA-directed RNA polymerase specialized sigma24 family protein
LPGRFAPIIAGVLAVAANSPASTAANSPARTAPRGAHRSVRLVSRRKTSCEPSADEVASLHAFVLRLVPEPADAADIAQQTLLLACSDQRGSRIANVDAWLRCIARHLVIDHFRAGNRHISVELRDALADSEPVLRTRSDLPLAVRESRERLRSLLDDSTGQLCLVHQIALLLADVYGHCDKYSATVLQMSVPCYKLVLHRARSAVRASRPEPARSAGWLGVACHLSTAELCALRRELLEGLVT